MSFCMNCGQKLPDDANFCYKCGTPTGSANSSHIIPKSTIPVEHEKMLECPKCGSSISRMDAVCPYCGAQIINKAASSTVKEFAERLYEIEREKEVEPSTGLMKLFGMNSSAMEKGYGSKAFDRKISLISTFPIPNTVEEITEFVIMAANSIDVQFGKKTWSNRVYGKPGTTMYADVTLANTWINKLQQAYDKASIAFPNHPLYKRIEEIYVNKMKELKRL